MSVPENIIIRLPVLVVLYAIAFLWFYWVRRLARKRNLESGCARCGKKIEKESQKTISNMIMCPGCFTKTSHNHKLAYWVIGLIIIIRLI